MSRVSRSVSAGKLADLNVNGEFFLGGHETYNFTRLPHDLPLHTGFTGCIFDLVLRCRRKYSDVCKNICWCSGTPPPARPWSPHRSEAATFSR